MAIAISFLMPVTVFIIICKNTLWKTEDSGCEEKYRDDLSWLHGFLLAWRCPDIPNRVFTSKVVVHAEKVTIVHLASPPASEDKSVTFLETQTTKRTRRMAEAARHRAQPRVQTLCPRNLGFCASDIWRFLSNLRAAGYFNRLLKIPCGTEAAVL